jgi:glycosyltransferase involved in cell wall biosynthesis
MRIALVTSGFLPLQGGGEYVVHNLANQWSEMGHEVRVVNVITNKAWHPEARYSVARFWIPRGAVRFGYHRQPWLGVASWGMSRVLNAFHPDVVSGHFAVPVAFYLARWPSAVPWTITAHGSDVVTGVAGSEADHYGCQKELGMALRRASAVVAVSQTAEDTLKSYSLRPGAVHRITNGVELNRFAKPVPGNMRRTLGIPLDSQFLLTVARNAPVKNLSLGLKAFAGWTGRPRNLYYVIVGKGVEDLEPEAARLGIKQKVVFIDAFLGQELAAAYQQALVYVSTSRREFCPLVILEAMAAGLPQVATKVPGNSELVIDNLTGLLADNEEPSSMSAAIEKLVSCPDLRSRLSRNCSKRAELYDSPRVAEQYLALFDSCLHGACLGSPNTSRTVDVVPVGFNAEPDTGSLK